MRTRDFFTTFLAGGVVFSVITAYATSPLPFDAMQITSVQQILDASNNTTYLGNVEYYRGGNRVSVQTVPFKKILTDARKICPNVVFPENILK